MLTAEEISGWIGRTAQDPYGEPIGRVAAMLHDVQTGSPEWLAIVPGGADQEDPRPHSDLAEGGPRDERSGQVAGDGAGDAVLVPLAGALETGRRVRVTPTAARIRDAPRIHVGDEIDVAGERRAAAHYGLALDTGPSGTGMPREPRRLRPPAAPEPPGPVPLAAATQERRAELVQALRAAHALEQASLKQLAAMRWRADDAELMHDLALHHKATNRHAERVRERLDELDAPRGRPLDWAAKLASYGAAQLGRLREHPDPGDLRGALELERREVEAYERLAHAARAAGDDRTAALALAIRADEEAMVATLERSRLRFER